MKIRTPDELNNALRELGQVNHAEETLQGECNAKVEEIKKRYADRMCLTVDGEKVSIAARRDALLDAISTYCEVHRDELLEGKAKSVKLTHGTIGWREQKDTIKTLNKTSEKDWLAKVFAPLIEKLLRAIATFSINKTIETPSVIKLSLTWDKASILKQLAEKKIKPNDLKPLGFKFVPGEDEFYCMPDKVTVESHQAAAA